ncbi:MAG: O-antigen ligase family protein [Deltaproteobacteria bacterium]|nr:O-antigen ligase family protein [Deltaproteobacteria bacterium]
MSARASAVVLALLAGLCAWSIAGMQVASGLLVLAFIATQGWKNAPALRAPTLAFAAICAASALLSPALGSFDLLAWRFALLAWLVAAVAMELGEAQTDRVAAVWIGAMVLAGAWGIFQAFTGKDLLALVHLRREAIVIESPWKDHFAALGFFNSRLTFANGLLVPLGLAGAWAVVGRGRARVLGVIASVVLTLALGLSFGRAAWWGALAAGAMLVLWRGGWRAALALVVVLGLALALPPVRARLASSVSVSQNEDRVFIWARAREVVADHPVLGVGYAAYPRVAAPYYDRVDPDFPMHTWAHDTPLSLLAEVGATGLAAYLWLWVAIYTLGAAAVRAGSTVALGLCAGTAGLHVASLFHDVLYDGEVAHALWIAGGLLAALGLRAASRNPRAEAST